MFALRYFSIKSAPLPSRERFSPHIAAQGAKPYNFRKNLTVLLCTSTLGLSLSTGVEAACNSTGVAQNTENFTCSGSDTTSQVIPVVGGQNVNVSTTPGYAVNAATDGVRIVNNSDINVNFNDSTAQGVTFGIYVDSTSGSEQNLTVNSLGSTITSTSTSAGGASGGIAIFNHGGGTSTITAQNSHTAQNEALFIGSYATTDNVNNITIHGLATSNAAGLTTSQLIDNSTETALFRGSGAGILDISDNSNSTFEVMTGAQVAGNRAGIYASNRGGFVNVINNGTIGGSATSPVNGNFSSFMGVDLRKAEGINTITNNSIIQGTAYSILGGAGYDRVNNEVNASIIGQIDLGEGNNQLTNKGGISGSSVNGVITAITTDQGDDTLNNQGGWIEGLVNLGDGDNTITNIGSISQDITGSAPVITTGQGNDTLNNHQFAYIDGAINLGDGNNSITNAWDIRDRYGVSGDIITTGQGNDTLNNQDGIIWGSINLGNGNNSIINAGTIRAVDVLVAPIITTGQGNDTLSNDERGVINGAINLGDGLNSVTNKGAIIGTRIDGVIKSFTAGKDADIFNNQNGHILGLIDLGEGDNSITNTTGIFGNSTTSATAITAGQGADSLNNAGGEIAGLVNLGGGTNSITNSARMTGSDMNGVITALITGQDADTLKNQGGTIQGYVNLGAGTNSITNSGFMTGSDVSGVITALTTGQDADTLNNQGGTIQGYVNLGAGTNSITNSANITGSDVSGVITALITGQDADTLNNNYGTIQGLINLGDGDNSITNTGSISGNANGDVTAITTGQGNDTLINEGNGNILGSVNLGAGTNSITNKKTMTGSNVNGVLTAITTGQDADTLNNYISSKILGLINLGGGDNSITNSWEITGNANGDVTAITTGQGADTLVNNTSGLIQGSVNLGAGTNSITNSGSMNGSDVNGVVTALTTGQDADTFNNQGVTIQYGTIQVQTAQIQGLINLGDGDNSITNTGSITGDASGNVTAITTGKDADRLNNAQGGTIRGAIDLGDGNNNILNNGNVTGSDVSGVVTALSTGQGADTLINDANGTIQGLVNLGDGNNSILNSGVAHAIQTGSGNDQLINNGGGIYGNIDLGLGNNQLIVTNEGSLNQSLTLGSGQDTIQFDRGTKLNNVASINTAAGSDTLILNGFSMSGYTAQTSNHAGTNLQNLEKIAIVNAGSLKLTSHLFSSQNSGEVSIEAGSQLDLKGNSPGIFTIFGNVNNNGLMTLKDGDADDVTTISGDYTGGGIVALDTFLSDDTAATDKLLIEGKATGNTLLAIASTGGSGALTDKGIKVVGVGVSSNQSAFTLQNKVEVGAYAYDLVYNDQADRGWFLQTMVDKEDVKEIGSNAATYEAGSPAALDTINSGITTLEQRVGSRSWNKSNNVTRAGHAKGLWWRGIGNYSHVNPRHTTADLSFNNYTGGFQFGADMLAHQSARGEYIVGLTGKFLAGRAHVKNDIGSGHVRNHIFAGGITSTWHGNNGFYYDSQNELLYADQKFSTNVSGRLKKKLHRWGYSSSTELGYRFHVGQHTKLVPQAQFTHAYLSKKSFEDKIGNDVRLQRAKSSIARIGLAYEYLANESNPLQQGNRLGAYRKAYVINNLLYDFSKKSKAEVSDTALEYRNNRAWAEVGVGGSWGWSERKSFFLEANYRNKISGHGANRGAKGTAGLQLIW